MLFRFSVNTAIQEKLPVRPRSATARPGIHLPKSPEKGRPEGREAPFERHPDLSTNIGMEHGVRNPTGNIEDLIKRGEDLCERLTVCPPSSPSECVDDTLSTEPYTPPLPKGDRASPSEHAIAPDIQGIDSFRPPTPFILSPASWWLESEAIVTEAVSADIAQSPTPSYTLLNDPGIQVHCPYRMLGIDGIRNRTEVDPPVFQHVVPPLPVLYAKATTSEHEDGDSIRYIPPWFMVPRDAYSSYPTTVVPLPVIREADRSVFDLYCETGNKEMVWLSVAPLGTGNVKPRQSKPRKQNTAQRERRKTRRTGHSKTQHLDMQQGQVQITPPLYTRLDLRVARQIRYRCGNTQGPWTQLPSIDFLVNRIEGIRLTDAMNAYFNGPDNRDDPMFMSESVGNTVSCRIHFEGYQPFATRQISTKNYKKERSRITRKKLAHEVAKCIEAYLKQLQATGTPFPVCFEDIFLTKLDHTAQAAWQPQIWYQVTPSTNS